MCKLLRDLHRKKYGECEDGAELDRWVKQANNIAEELRNRIVHGSLTIDDEREADCLLFVG